MNYIDLNCDMGEIPEAIADGSQEQLMQFITSVNIACGGHAGDASTMKATVEQALRRKLAIGAHPSYPDRANFGRVEMKIPPEAIAHSVCGQVRTLADIAARCGATVTHVKPHGALYNGAARDPLIAQAIAEGVARWNSKAVLVGLAGSSMLEIFRKAGFQVAAEAFADRRYEPDGSLRSRQFPDSLITDADEAAAQALSIAEDGTALAINGSRISIDAQTICIHGDYFRSRRHCFSGRPETEGARDQRSAGYPRIEQVTRYAETSSYR